MLSLPPRVKVFAALAPTDMSKSFNGLIGIVEKELGHQVEDGDLFLFFNRRRDRLKVLCFTGDGLLILLFGDNYRFALARTTCFSRTSLLPLGRRQPPWGLRKLPKPPRQPGLRGLRYFSVSGGVVCPSSLRRFASSRR